MTSESSAEGRRAQQHSVGDRPAATSSESPAPAFACSSARCKQLVWLLEDRARLVRLVGLECWQQLPHRAKEAFASFAPILDEAAQVAGQHAAALDENERLREALREIRDCPNKMEDGYCVSCREVASEALESLEGGNS